MRKYEPAGGVVPCQWRHGEVPSCYEFGVVLREVWALGWGWHGAPKVTARIGVYRWDDEAKEWKPLHGGMTGRVVRWMRVGMSHAADLTLTLKEWPNV